MHWSRLSRKARKYFSLKDSKEWIQQTSVWSSLADLALGYGAGWADLSGFRPEYVLCLQLEVVHWSVKHVIEGLQLWKV